MLWRYQRLLIRRGRCLAIEVGFSLPAKQVVITSKSATFRRCYGPEFINGRFKKWANLRGIRIQYIQPGNPQQNAYIERFNRDEQAKGPRGAGKEA